jgi:hypothetical protein
MIKNNKQYRVALDQIGDLTAARDRAMAVEHPDVFVQAHIDALRTDLVTLEDDARQYESLRQGAFDLSALRAIGHIGMDRQQ